MAQPPFDPDRYRLQHAQIEWQDGNVPTAKHYDDIYFSPSHGLEETRYVFLHHSHLAQRWQALSNDTTPVFGIAELGFGTGLNFLATWQLWQQQGPVHTQLHYVAVEKHPLQKGDLARSLAKWPELTTLAEQLLEQYPVLIPGHHVIRLDGGNVILHLLLGDAEQCFEQLRATSHAELAASAGYKFDAWFLDGFAPAKNPDLWSDKLLTLIAELSKVGTTVATFTAAGFVRRSLMQLGFEVEKVPGFKQKREMLRAEFQARSNTNEKVSDPSHHQRRSKNPWYVLPKKRLSKRQAIVIGAGLAGVSSAYALAQRGWQVTLIDRQPDVAREASGNPQGMLYTKLSPKPGKLNDFALASYLYAVRFYQQLVAQRQIDAADFDFCGLLQLVMQQQELPQFHALQQQLAAQPELVQFVNAEQASQLSAVELKQSAYYFPNAGWIAPAKLCRQLSHHRAIHTVFNHEVIDLQYEQAEHSQPGQWRLFDQQQQILAQAPVVIIANSLDARRFQCSAHFPIKPIRGQISRIPANGPLAMLKTVICHDGYITPAIAGNNTIGATFGIGDDSTEQRSADHQHNINNLYRAIPSLHQHNTRYPSTAGVNGRVGIRCTAPDYLPIVGQLPDYSHFVNHYARLRKDANWQVDTPGQYLTGLYVNVAHGSRGLTSTPLCSELLAAIINGEPPPLPRQLLKALHPARFVIRDLIRNRI